MRQRGLRNRAKAQRLRRQQEIADISPAIDRAIDPERLVGVADGDMRRALGDSITASTRIRFSVHTGLDGHCVLDDR